MNLYKRGGELMLRHYLVPYNRKKEDDPLFAELTYGHQEERLNRVKKEEYIFFHTKIFDKRYITAYYQVFDRKSVKEIREEPYISSKYRNHHILNGKDTDIIIFGHPVYSYVLEKPLLLDEELLSELIGDKKINQGKIIMLKNKEKYLLDLINKHQRRTLQDVSLTTNDIYHLRENDIENFLAHNPKLLGQEIKYIDRQKQFEDKLRLDLLLKDENGYVIVEIKKGLINQDTYN